MGEKGKQRVMEFMGHESQGPSRLWEKRGREDGGWEGQMKEKKPFSLYVKMHSRNLSLCMLS